MVNELIPCPFCGGAARTASNNDWHRIWVKHSDDCALDPDEAALMYPATPQDLAAMVERWNRRATLPQPSAEPVRGTVGEIRATLAPFDGSMPINAAFFVAFQGKRECRVKPLTLSRERVADGKWIRTGDESVPYSLIAWANQDERATPAPIAAETAPDPRLQDLRMLVERLARRLAKADPLSARPAEALDYLKRVGLTGSPLRTAPAAPLADTGAVAVVEGMGIEYTKGVFFHTNCHKTHFGGISRPIKNETDHSVIECLACGLKGKYPVGGIGERCCEIVHLAAPAITTTSDWTVDGEAS